MTQGAAARKSTPAVDLDSRRAVKDRRNPKPPEAPPKPVGPYIKQQDIAALKALRDDVKALEASLAEAKKAVAEAEVPFFLALSVEGHILEPGRYAIAIKIDKRRNPKWREEFEQVLGKDAAEKVIERTEPSITRKLVISGGEVAAEA